jgi:hypothetical protein
MTTHVELGMQLMDGDLTRLVREGVVDPDEAMLKALDKAAFAAFVEAFKQGKDGIAQRSEVPPASGEGPTTGKRARPPGLAGGEAS